MTSIVPVGSTAVVDSQAQLVVDFLRNIGLPHENIIAAQEERSIIHQNLPAYISSLPPDVKQGATYLSKFVVGASFGLFDYSLNAIWNEVVLDLHKKAISYGLDIFYDAAVGGKARGFYQSEDELGSLKDSVLLDTCRKLELIGETTHKKLKHILDMRNDIGISHPTNYTINAFELLGWLQTCINDVLKDRPTEAALQVKAFIQNLKTYSTPIDASTTTAIESNINALASHHCGNILRTMFGIYVSSDTDPQVRKNISLSLRLAFGRQAPMTQSTDSDLRLKGTIQTFTRTNTSSASSSSSRLGAIRFGRTPSAQSSSTNYWTSFWRSTMVGTTSSMKVLSQTASHPM